MRVDIVVEVVNIAVVCSAGMIFIACTYCGDGPVTPVHSFLLVQYALNSDFTINLLFLTFSLCFSITTILYSRTLFLIISKEETTATPLLLGALAPAP